MSKNNYNKWNSRRWRITVWSIITTTIVLLYSMITRYSPDWLGIVIPLLVAIPNVYIAAESYTKVRIDKKEQESEEYKT